MPSDVYFIHFRPQMLATKAESMPWHRRAGFYVAFELMWKGLQQSAHGAQFPHLHCGARIAVVFADEKPLFWHFHGHLKRLMP